MSYDGNGYGNSGRNGNKECPGNNYSVCKIVKGIAYENERSGSIMHCTPRSMTVAP